MTRRWARPGARHGQTGGLAEPTEWRQIRRTARYPLTGSRPGKFTVSNDRGARIGIGTGDADFTPVELLLAAIGGCTSIDVDILTSRRAVELGTPIHVRPAVPGRSRPEPDRGES